jgi:hypothetical protein
MAAASYHYGGARALVALHDLHLRQFLETWHRADNRSVDLPATSDPSYVSREALLVHVLGCAARYLTWICEQLGLPDPGLEENPSPKDFVTRAENYLEGVLAAWEIPLRELTEEQATSTTYTSRWGTPYCIDAMLEHAVMHPIRHSHQLDELMAAK